MVVFPLECDRPQFQDAPKRFRNIADLLFERAVARASDAACVERADVATPAGVLLVYPVVGRVVNDGCAAAERADSERGKRAVRGEHIRARLALRVAVHAYRLK